MIEDHFALLILAFVVSLMMAALVSLFGRRIGLVDIPNDRSSHSIPTPRGGGLGIWVALLAVVPVVTSRDMPLILVAGGIGLIGLAEDFFAIPAKLRLIAQLILSAVVAVSFSGVPGSMGSLAKIIFWIIIITGTGNFYNFMDGINGIAALSGIVGFGLMSYFFVHTVSLPDLGLICAVTVAACMGFLPFNFPKAKVFMGDAGSLALGFLFASLVLAGSGNMNILLCLPMFLCTFYADAVVTILYRWRRGDNLGVAHRSHLYQYMSNELKIPHWKVSALYGLVQALFGALAIAAFGAGATAQLAVIVIFGALFCFSYLRVKKVRPREPQVTGCL